MNLLEVNKLTKSYTDKIAIENIDLSVKRGCIHGLLGPNGAGKTTLIRCVNRIIMPDSGEVLLNGKPISQEDVYKIGYMPEERGLYKKMKVGEQIIFFAMLKGLTKSEALKRAKVMMKEFEIIGWWDKKIEDLSKGMAQKIQFINTVIHEPEILILDEPFSGFDPINANLIKSKVFEYKERGVSIVLSTHDMSSVESICDEFTLISNSKCILSGNVDKVRENYAHGIYRLVYYGKNSDFVSRLHMYCTFEDQSDHTSANTTLSVKLYSAINVREFVDFVNINVDIIEFSKSLPSMNDIFIRAVGGEVVL